MLRWQRLNAAVAGAFFSALWPAVGLPSSTEVEGLRSDVRAMREELRDAVAERDSKDDFASELHIAVRESIVNQQADEKLVARATNGHPQLRSTRVDSRREEDQRLPILGLVGMARRGSDGER